MAVVTSSDDATIVSIASDTKLKPRSGLATVSAGDRFTWMALSNTHNVSASARVATPGDNDTARRSTWVDGRLRTVMLFAMGLPGEVLGGGGRRLNW